MDTEKYNVQNLHTGARNARDRTEQLQTSIFRIQVFCHFLVFCLFEVLGNMMGTRLDTVTIEVPFVPILGFQRKKRL